MTKNNTTNYLAGGEEMTKKNTTNYLAGGEEMTKNNTNNYLAGGAELPVPVAHALALLGESLNVADVGLAVQHPAEYQQHVFAVAVLASLCKYQQRCCCHYRTKRESNI